MSAERIATALGGRRVGGGWMARCPAHDDATPSLAIKDGRDGKVLVHCFAGCEQAAVIAALRERGLWENGSNGDSGIPRRDRAANPASTDNDRRRTASALRVWCGSRDISDTPAAAYLRSRYITIPAPRRLKFHPGLKHPSGSTWPAMVALVTLGADDRAIGVHRTFLARDGSAKAPVRPAKMMLGPCRGGAVRLGPVSTPLLIGEGIETALAAMQATGHTAWAALSTSGLKMLDLPDCVRDIVILADGDPPGEAAALAAAARWELHGRRVRIARPPEGQDFADLLTAGRCGNSGPSR